MANKKGPLIPELAPLLRWIADVESVLTGKAVLVYNDWHTGLQYTCAVCIKDEIVGQLFEREADVRPSNVGCDDPPLVPRMELWVVGKDPACNCVTGALLRLCTVAKEDRRG